MTMEIKNRDAEIATLRARIAELEGKLANVRETTGHAKRGSIIATREEVSDEQKREPR
jgi:hypothetical protein